jgi:hypothetical protein
LLVIREAQMAALSRELRSRFEREALEHVKACFPEQCAEVGEEYAFYYVQQGLRRARDYGFESQYDLLRFLNLMFALGGDFDTSEEHLWTRRILDSRDMAPTTRMDSLLHEFYVRLFPGYRPDGDDAQMQDEPLAPDTPREFDGIVWEDNLGPDYVPQSIVPEMQPYERGPAPGSVAAPPVAEQAVAQQEGVLVGEGEDRGGR